MIEIKNVKIFNCNITKNYHWSNLLRLKEKMFQQKIKFPKFSELRNANLMLANLQNADFEGCDLSESNLRYSNLQNANLKGADLRFANLNCADLSGADLTYACITDAILTNTFLYNAKLTPIDGKEVIIKDYISIYGILNFAQWKSTIFIFSTNIGIVIMFRGFYGIEKECIKRFNKEWKHYKNFKDFIEILKFAKKMLNKG